MHTPDDTSTVSLRLLGRAERGAVMRHFLRLGPEERQHRFSHAASDDYIHRYCDGLEESGAILVGAFVDGEIRGLAELLGFAGSWPRTCEFAVSVQAAYQSRGIGTALIRQSLLVARNRWISRVCMTCLWENVRMRRIARAMGARVTTEGGEADGELRLLWPTCLSVLSEAAGY